MDEEKKWMLMTYYCPTHGGSGFVKPIQLTKNEVRKLNKMVVDYCVKEVSSNVKQYDTYVKDLENLPVPLDRPAFDPATGNTTYDLSNFVGI